jgi:AcrR family transcriptional regulator
MPKNRKQELIKLAYELFIKEGYDNVSVDEIIAKANIAKGTFYYYFKSKEEMLGQVAEYMAKCKIASAEKYFDEPVPVEKKLFSIIVSLVNKDNKTTGALNSDDNIKLRTKYNEQIVMDATPLLKRVVNEGNKKAIFHCNHVEERAKMIFVLSNNLFSNKNYTIKDVEAFIDITEKTLGAKKGMMEFAKNILGGVSV